MEDPSNYLTGKFLVAMAGMPDPRFVKALILICGHDENGAMGLVINRPLMSLTFNDLLDNLKIDAPQDFANIKLHFGGPVEVGRGFVIHSNDYKHESTVRINDDVSLTATADILKAIVDGKGPNKMLLALGYAGWGATQLDQEIVANGWIVTDFSQDVLFNVPIDVRWDRALALAGIKADMISLEGGRA
jgi:putative transcriptional regulator